MSTSGICNACGTRVFEELQIQPGFRILCAGREVPFDIRTVLCRHCGLIATQPQPDTGLLAAFYAAQERDLFVEGEEPGRIPGAGSRRDQARWLEAGLGSLEGRRVLEVGCYEGYLLHLLGERGARGLGIEPSERAAALGRERWGVEIRTGLFEEQELAPEGFDLVALSHVLEHLADPRAALERAWTLLAPGGALFIEVPDVLQPRVESAVDFFTFDHLFNFSPATLAALLASCGFEVFAQKDDFPFPAFRMLARKVPARGLPVPAAPQTVETCRRVVRRYVAARHAFLERLRSRIDRELAAWQAAEARIAIYGAGYHTQCLLDATDLRKARLVALVDGNPAKWGREILGLPVVGPEELPTLRPDAVVISSYDFQEEMVERLRRLGLGHLPAITFYPEVKAFSNAG